MFELVKTKTKRGLANRLHSCNIHALYTHALTSSPSLSFWEVVRCCRNLGHIRLTHISSVELPEQRIPQNQQKGLTQTQVVCFNSQNRTHALSCSLPLFHIRPNVFFFIPSHVPFVFMCVIYTLTQGQNTHGKMIYVSTLRDKVLLQETSFV